MSAAAKPVETVAVLGLGKVGLLVAELLGDAGFTVVGADARGEEAGLPGAVRLEVGDQRGLRSLLESVNAAISCLPYSLNAPVATACCELGVHYLDLTEDRGVSEVVRRLGRDASAALIPHCGLAPGFICVVGRDLADRVEDPQRLMLRVGALPRSPSGALGYAFTWSASGVVNEYLNDCEVLRNGQRGTVPALSEPETLVLDGISLEAFTTSGGLGTMCETFEGRIASLDYKSLRYPGHCDLIRFFLHELRMGGSRGEAERILDAAYPPVREDVVFVFAVAEGSRQGPSVREEFVRIYHPREIGGAQRTAIAWTTAAGVVSVLELLAAGETAGRGLVRQEDLSLQALLATKAGGLLATDSLAAGNEVAASAGLSAAR